MDFITEGFAESMSVQSLLEIENQAQAGLGSNPNLEPQAMKSTGAFTPLLETPLTPKMLEVAQEESILLGTTFESYLLPTVSSPGELERSPSERDLLLGAIATPPLAGEPNSDFLTRHREVEPAASNEIMFIDRGVEDYQNLIAGVAPGTEVVLLDTTRDGVAQISEVLAQRIGISAVHIVSHGESGSLQLGSTQLSLENFSRYTSQFQGWTNSLTTEADILLYGCNLAAGEAGQTLVQQLGQLTGADVAASTDLTGNAALGGDWDFELTTGAIESAVIFQNNFLTAYNSVLASFSGNQTIGATTFNEEVIISGDVVLNVSGDFNLGDLGNIVGDGTGPLDNLTLQVDGAVTIGGFIGGGGLQNLTIAATAINILEDVTISSRQVLGNNFLNGASIADSGSLTFNASTITLENGAQLLAQVETDSTFQGGDIALNARDETNAAEGENVLGELLNSTAVEVEVGIESATLLGRNISIDAQADLTASAQGRSGDVEIDGVRVEADASANINIFGNSRLESSGNLSISAHSQVEVAAIAEAKEGDDTALDAAIALANTNNAAIARVSGNTTLSAGGDLRLLAQTDTEVKTTADGTAGGDDAAGATVAIATIDTTTEAYIDESASIAQAASVEVSATASETFETQATSTAGGTEENSADTEQQLQDNNAATSDGNVDTAAALAIAKTNRRTRAYIATDGAIASDGDLDIRATSSANSSVAADATATGDSAGLGVAVGINRVDGANEAYIGGTGAIAAENINIESKAGDGPNQFSTEARSGAGGSNVGVAGALALNLVKNNQSQALIKEGAATNVNGANVSLTAENKAIHTAKALPKNEDDNSSKIGVGASVAVNVANNTTRAEVENGATLSQANHLTLAATSEQETNAIAEAGSAGGTAINPMAALSLGESTTVARVGTGEALGVSGNLKLDATHRGKTNTTAKGETAGENVGIGASFALTEASDTTSATLERAIAAEGDISLAAQSDVESKTTAMASAKGGKAEDENTAENGVDKQTQQQRSYGQSQNSQGNTQQTQAPSAATSEGTVSVAAAIGVNLVNSKAQAAIAEGTSVTAGGNLTLKATKETDATVKADGSAEGDAKVGVGAAVALNRVESVNEASIGANARVAATGIAIEANMAGGAGTTHDFKAEAIAGAGATTIGVAGALALNDSQSQTIAQIGSGAIADSNGADLAIAANNVTKTTVDATSQRSTKKDDKENDDGNNSNNANSSSDNSIGIGASVALNLTNDLTQASLGENAQLNDVRALNITAKSSDEAQTKAVGGAEGGIAIDASVAVANLNQTTQAAIASGTQIVTQNGATVSSTNTSRNTTRADGEVAGEDIGIGASVAVVTTDSQTQALIDRGLRTTDGNLEIAANSDRTYETTAQASAKGAQSKSDRDSSQNSQSQSDKSLKENKAETQNGTVDVAAAVAVSKLNDDAIARLSGGTSQIAGDINITATNQANFATKGKGAAKGQSETDVKVGVGVGINITNNQTTALVGDNTAIQQVQGLNIRAESKQNVSDEFKSKFAAEAISGASKAGEVGIAGSLAIARSKDRTQAFIGNNATINTTGDLAVTSSDTSRLSAQARATSLNNEIGIGASVALLSTNRANQAFLGKNSTVNASKVLISATNHRLSPEKFQFTNFGNLAGDLTQLLRTNNYYTEAIAGSGNKEGTLQVAGSFAVNDLKNRIETWIGEGTSVSTTGNLFLSSLNDIQSKAIAGNIAATLGDASVGLGSASILNTAIARSFIQQGTAITAANIEVNATSDQDLAAFGISLAGATGKVGIAGVANVVKANNTTAAFIADSNANNPTTIAATGNLNITAKNTFNLVNVAGGAAGGGKAGVGLSTAISKIENNTQAYIGQFTTANIANNTTIQAEHSDDILAIAAGGAVGGTAGIAGSATVTLLDNHTLAYVGENSQINRDRATANDAQTVSIHASDETKIVGIGGAIAGGGSAGIGIGADVGIITKTTQAFIADSADVAAQNNVIVDARSKEDITSISASLAAGGTAGIGASVGVSKISLTTEAYIGSNAKVQAEGNVVVSADDQTEIDVFAGGAAVGGGAGVGASVVVPIITKTTQAFIGSGANVTAKGLKNSIEVNNGQFGLTFVDNPDDSQEVSAPNFDSSNSDRQSDSQALNQQRVATASKRTIQGLAVTATNQDDLESYAIGVSAGGSAAINLSGNINILNNNTQAYIGDRAIINADHANAGRDQSVLVAAGNDLYHMGITGSAAVSGGVGLAPAAEVSIFSNNTHAYIGAAAQVQARQNVQVQAEASEEILSIGIGLGAAGVAAIAGTVSVISLKNSTHAYINNDATVRANGNVLVSATNDTETDVIAGGVGVGLGGGLGASVGVVLIDKDTQAYIGQGATVDGKANTNTFMPVFGDRDEFGISTESIGGVAVQAESSEDVFTVTVAGGGGLFVGVAGAATVNIINSNTTAFIGENALINQDTAGAGNAQTVNVSAVNDLELFGAGGSAAAGLVALAGGVDIGIVENNTSAYIGNGARVNARQDIDVNAFSSKEIEGVAVSGSVGPIVGVAGSVAIHSIGAALDDRSRNSLKTDKKEGEEKDPTSPNAQSFVDDQVQVEKTLLPRLDEFSSVYADDDSPDSRENSQQVADAIRDTRTSAADRTPKNRVSNAVNRTDVPVGTNAFIGRGAAINAGRDIDVEAQDTLDFDVTVGAASGGIVGIGGSVAIANIAENTQAYIDNSATVAAGNDISVTAQFNETLDGKGFAGGAGLVGLGAQVVIFNEKSHQAAYINDGANISQADTLQVTANAEQTLKAESIGVATGGVAAGAAIARNNVEGSTRAYLGDVNIGQGNGTVNDLNLAANSTVSSEATAFAVSAGVLAGGAGASAKSNVNPTIEATICNGANIAVANDINILSTSKTQTTTEAKGFSFGGKISIGVSESIATMTPEVNAAIGQNANIDAGGNLVIQAIHNEGGETAFAKANPSSGSLGLSAIGADAKAEANAKVSASVGAGTTINTDSDLALSANGTNKAITHVNGISGAILGSVGFTAARANAGGTVEATMDGAVIQAKNLSVSANAVGLSETNNKVFTAAAVSTRKPVVKAETTTATKASIGNGINSTDIATTGNVIVQAIAQTDAGATGSGKGGGLIDVGVVKVETTREATVSAAINPEVSISAGGDIEVQSTHGREVEVNDGTFDLANVDNNANNSDAITFTQNHGLISGDEVVYQNNGGASIGGLEDNRTYSVIHIDDRTVRLGAEFTGAQIDDAKDTITFAQPHAFETGDRVIYDNGGEATLGGLVSGQVYFVRVIDDSTIKLTETLQGVNLSPKNFTPSTVTNSALTVNNHGFQTGDALTYRAPEPDNTFAANQIDYNFNIIDIAKGITEGNKPTHNFNTGDAILYETDNDPIGGLINGQTYYIVRINDSQFQLAASLADAVNPQPQIIDLTESNSPGNQFITASSKRPITGLIDGNTYYAVQVNGNQLRLAATQQDALLGNHISLNTAGLTGEHSIGLEGVDLSTSNVSGNAPFSLYHALDPSVASGANHQLEGAGGALALATAPGSNGIAKAVADSSSGNIFGASNAETKVSSTVNTDTTIGDGVTLVGNNITIGATSFNLATASSRNFAGGLGTGGNGDTDVSVDNNSIATIGNNASIQAQGTFKLSSQASQDLSSSSEAKGVGGIGIALSKNKLNLDYQSIASVGQGTAIQTKAQSLDAPVEGDLVIEALTTDTNVSSKVSSLGAGAGGGSNAFINFSNDSSLTQVKVDSGADLVGNAVTLKSQTQNLNVDLNAKAKAGGIGAGVNVESNFNFDNTRSEVRLEDNASVSGLDKVNISAHNDNIASKVKARGEVFAFAGGGKVEAVNQQDIAATVFANPGSKIETPELLVEADTTEVSNITNASKREAGPFVFIKSKESPDLTYDRTIDFNSILSAEPDPELVINAEGEVICARNVDIIDTDGETLGPVEAENIVVDDIRNDTQMTAVFRIATRDFGPGEIFGNPVFQETYDSVNITNHSQKNLVINNIDVINQTIPNIVVEDGQVIRKDTFAKDPVILPRLLAPTFIDIQNQSSSDVLLNGLISNPHDTTQILNTGGDILSVNPNAAIETRVLKLDSEKGNIGTGKDRVTAQLIQGYAIGEGYKLEGNKLRDPSLQPEIRLTATADESIYLDIQGVRRNDRPLVIHSDRISTNVEDVDLRIRQGINGDRSPEPSTYEFDLIQAGGDIIIDAGNTDTTLIGNTDILSTGKLDVVTGDDVDFTEIAGELDIRQVYSDSGDIRLTVRDSDALGEDLILDSEATVRAIQGSVDLRAGDDIVMAMEAIAQANDSVTIQGDFGNADAGLGSTVSVRGTIDAPLLIVTGDADADRVNLNEARYTESSTNLQDGDDTFDGGTNRDVVFAGSGDDFIDGRDGNDELHGGEGNDTLLGSEGDDALLGEAGNDTLNGGEGDDQLNGGEGDDKLLGEAGDDTLNGESGEDTLMGGVGADLLLGGDGDDELEGQGGDDELHGGNGADDLLGGDGNDRLNGDADSDNLDGGDGNDSLNGGAAIDVLIGGDGDDRLSGDEGDDYVEGGEGADWFRAPVGDGDDFFADFEDGVDVLDSTP